MNNFFERYTFLECFDTELVEGSNCQCCETYTYSLTDTNCIFIIGIDYADKSVSINLTPVNSDNPFFHLYFNGTIDHISLTKECAITFLNLFKDPLCGPFRDRTTEIPFLKIMIKPRVCIRWEL
jgi:hypothetical protein